MPTGCPDVAGGGCPADNCPDVYNPDQEDEDSDDVGDSCDVCLGDPLNDSDADGFCSIVDNCPEVYNPDQTRHRQQRYRRSV